MAWLLAACFALVLAPGCGDEPEDEPPAPAVFPPQPPPRTVEAPTPEPRFGFDERGRLKAAERLVNGYEVPLGVKLVHRTRSYLEFELRAPMEKIREFYDGVDIRTDRRFAERGYAIADAVRGFDVHHTSESLERLDLDLVYQQAHIFVTPRVNRTQTVRVHTVPEPARDPADNPHFHPANFDRPSATRVAEADPQQRTTTAEPEPEPQAAATPAPARPAATSGGRAVTPAQQRAVEAARQRRIQERYGPYPRGRGTDHADQIREWRRANPGQLFYD